MISSVISLSSLNLAVRWHFDPRPMQIVSLHSVEPTKHKQPLIVENHSLVECARGERDVEGDSPRPSLQLEVVLMNVVESFES